MNDVERLLELDRSVPLPELPDPAYTAATVARRLGRSRRRESDPLNPWLLAGIAAAVGLGLLGLALLQGASPYWLLTGPLLLVSLSPILRKGVR